MRSTTISISEGFKGQKSIMLPIEQFSNPAFSKKPLQITHMGYYPNATHHYRSRAQGCDEHILIFCAGGRGWIEHDGSKKSIIENMFYIIPANEAHSYGSEKSHPWSIYWIHFQGESETLLDPIKGKSVELQVNGSQSAKNSLDLFNNIYYNLAENYQADTMEYVNYAFKYFLASLKHQDKFQKQTVFLEEDFVQKCKNFMLSDLTNKLCLTELSHFMGYSVSHLTRLFTERLHMSPMAYYNKLRIDQACHYLRHSNYKIKEIAFLLGYFDQYHFSKNFHKYLGVTPSTYRNQP